MFFLGLVGVLSKKTTGKTFSAAQIVFSYIFVLKESMARGVKCSFSGLTLPGAWVAWVHSFWPQIFWFKLRFGTRMFFSWFWLVFYQRKPLEKAFSAAQVVFFLYFCMKKTWSVVQNTAFQGLTLRGAWVGCMSPCFWLQILRFNLGFSNRMQFSRIIISRIIFYG